MTEETPQPVRQEILQALQMARLKRFDQAEALLSKIAGSHTGSADERAVVHSTHAMILRKMGRHNEAWKAYRQAEDCIPDDPVMKLIIARFLIDEAGQYDMGIRKAQLILKFGGDMPSFRHQAHALMGLAFLKKNNQKKALEMLEKTMEDHFHGIVSVENIDFNFVEALMRRGIFLDRCKEYLRIAAERAKEKKEYKYMSKFRKILDSANI